MTVETLLSRLENVRRTGAGRWIARCPAHDDRHASMSVREIDDGTVLLHDFGAQCEVSAIVAAVGLELSALFPQRSSSSPRGKRERRPFPAADILRCVAFEALIASVAAANLAKGIPLSDDDRKRLSLAAGRLQAAVSAFHE